MSTIESTPDRYDPQTGEQLPPPPPRPKLNVIDRIRRKTPEIKEIEREGKVALARQKQDLKIEEEVAKMDLKNREREISTQVKKQELLDRLQIRKEEKLAEIASINSSSQRPIPEVIGYQETPEGVTPVVRMTTTASAAQPRRTKFERATSALSTARNTYNNPFNAPAVSGIQSGQRSSSFGSMPHFSVSPGSFSLNSGNGLNVRIAREAHVGQKPQTKVKVTRAPPTRSRSISPPSRLDFGFGPSSTSASSSRHGIPAASSFNLNLGFTHKPASAAISPPVKLKPKIVPAKAKLTVVNASGKNAPVVESPSTPRRAPSGRSLNFWTS